MKENEVEMVGHVKHWDENSILRRVMEVEGRRPVGRPKKTCIRVEEEDILRKLNITEDMAEDRHHLR